MYVFCAVSEMWICFQKMLDWLVRKNHHFVDQNGYSQKIAKNDISAKSNQNGKKLRAVCFLQHLKLEKNLIINCINNAFL